MIDAIISTNPQLPQTNIAGQMNYPFPAKAGQIGLLWFDVIFPQLVQRVLNKLPAK